MSSFYNLSNAAALFDGRQADNGRRQALLFMTRFSFVCDSDSELHLQANGNPNKCEMQSPDRDLLCESIFSDLLFFVERRKQLVATLHTCPVALNLQPTKTCETRISLLARSSRAAFIISENTIFNDHAEFRERNCCAALMSRKLIRISFLIH